MSEEIETTTSEYWTGRWKEGDIAWHRDEVNAYLIKYIDELTGGRSNTRVFVPLCGKTVDMLWFADQGHTVVGVELANKAIESFFTENNLTFTLESVQLAAAAAASEPAEVFKCNEKPITIFCCDLFALSGEDFDEKFDAIWDRASLVAIVPSAEDRGKRYAKHMHSLLASDGNFMVESIYYELDRGNNLPASISEKLRNEIFGEDFTAKFLDIKDMPEVPNTIFTYDHELRYHLFKPKTS